MKWFGQSWGASVCDPAEQIDTPVGRVCFHCELPIQEHDRGFVMPHMVKLHEIVTTCCHLSCLLANVTGNPPSIGASRRLR